MLSRLPNLRTVAVVAAIAVVPAVVGTFPPAATAKAPPQALWRPGGVQRTATVPVRPPTAPGLTADQRVAAAKAAKPFTVPHITWPSGTAAVELASASWIASAPGATRRLAVPGVPARAGSLPVTVASEDPDAAAARSVTVRVMSQGDAARVGVTGVVMGLTRGDGGSSSSPVTVTLDYSGFAAGYGGAWADRLKLVALPACALSTPDIPACRMATAVRFTQNRAAQTLTAQINVGTGQASRPTVIAATPSPSGSVGSYAATSLSPAGQWSAGQSSGGFTYTYPITLPSSAGIAAPDVTLSYDSGSVDGRTSATNAQASWIGDGFEYSPGYIERSYQPCTQDGQAKVTDLCWAGNEVQVELGSHSSTLVRDVGGTWKLKNDDGTKVVPLTGVNNGAWNGEAWELITTDGTQYYFGQNYLPTTSASGPSTRSVWTEPIYCPNSGEPCNSAANGTNSYAQAMAWRWNLAYVVDPHGNLQTYSWTPETNYYQRGYIQGNGTGSNTSYIRGGYLSTISYGYRLSDAIAGTKPVDVVTFGVDERCLSGCGSITATTAANWPDVPYDQICAIQTAACSNYSPSFFSTKRLTSIATTVLAGSGYQNVDKYTLTQMFPAPQAGEVTGPGVSATNPGDSTVAVMWLKSIQRTGMDTLGGGTAVSLPAVQFTAMETPNRVDGSTTGAAALYRPRMDSITTNSGSQIVVSYADPQCSRVAGTMPASPDSDTMNCFPQYWTDGTGPVLDWFTKPQVSSVTVNDLVAPAGWSEAQVTSYTYGGIAWHRDDSPLTPAAQRTWNQFRGYRTVTTTTGAASGVSVPTQTVSTYLQGMDGDHDASGATRSVTVHDTVGDTVTDSNWLQGKVLETRTLLGAGGTVERKTVGGPWTYTTTATETQANSMPALVARMAGTERSRGFFLRHDGSWGSTETDTVYDSSSRVVSLDAKGDGTSAVPEVCTTTAYAQDAGRTMLDYPAEVKAVQGACGTTPTATSTVSDTRTYYDSSTALGTLTGSGDPTKVEVVDSYNSSGAPQYVTQKTGGYDAYGRVVSVTDADGHTTETAYSTPGASPDQVTVTNPMGWTTLTTLDPGRGQPVSATDVDGKLTTQNYDGAGDLTAVWSPLHSQAAKDPADRLFTYAFGGATAPTTASAAVLLDNGSYDTDVKLYDGSLRQIQDQAPTADGSRGRVLTDTHYNSLGQTVKTTNGYVDATTNPSTVVTVPAVAPTGESAVPEETETSYDGLGRTVKSLVVAQGYNQWATSTGYAGTDESDTTPPAGGTASSTFTDVLGRTTASWKYNTATPTGKRADATATNYTYTAAGRTRTIADNAGNVWQYTYDLHGRQTQLVDPGAGMSSTVYSPGGEVLSTKDGRGVQLTYQYDKLARKTAEFNTTGNVAATGSDQLAAWTYDTLAKGQPTAQSRYTNGASDATHTYTTAVDGYTALYQSTGTTVTIPSAEGNLAGIYHDGSIYSDTTSRLDATRYYGEGGLPGEIVTYSYTPTGLITSFGGTNTYLNDVAYSPQGKVLQTNFGVSGRQFVRTEQYDLPTTRLLKVQDQAQPVTAALDATSYTYNPAGAITSESDVQSGVAVADTQCFGYDQQGRLTAAWTDTNGVTASVASTSVPIAGIGGCVDAAPVAGKVTGGPAPYWESFGYGPLGDRIAETNHDTSVSGTAADRSQTLAYNGSGTTPASLPSAVRSVTSTTSTGSTTSTYGYDTAGNTTSRAGQSFTYDAEGHTASVTDTGTGATTGYTYAADGTLLLQRNPATHQTILYLPYGQELHLDTSSGAVSGLRYYSASPDGVTVLRDSAGTVVYELTDPLRTATTIVDATSLAVTRRYSDPYGNVRGPAPLAWPDQHGFLGKPVDSTTGLSLLGARQYDSVTGRFLSVDPILESGDGRQMNGYSYAADNPVNASDPNGLRAMGDASGSSCGWNGTCTGSAAASPTPDQALVQWISHIHTYHKLAGLMVSEDDPHYARLKQMATTIAKDGQGYGLNGPTQEFLDWDSYCQAHPSFCGPDLSGAIKSALYDENGVMRHFMASYSILVNGDDTARPGSGLGSAEILLTSTPLAMLTGVFTYRSKGTTPGRDNSPKYGPSTIKIDNTKTYLVGSVNESGDFEYGYRGPNVQAPESTLPTELPPGPDTNPLQDLENGFPKTKAGEIVGGTADLLGGFGVGHGPQM